MVKLHIIGDIFSNSGYSSHTRQLTNALFKINPNISLDCPRPLDWVRYVTDDELKILSTLFDQNDTVISITQPIFSKLYIADNYRQYWQYCVWEGDHIPLYWLKHLNNPKITGILVPSLDTKQSILTTINMVKKQRKRGFKEVLKEISDKDLDSLEKKIFIIHHGVNPKLFYKLKIMKKQPKRSFIFLMAKGWAQEKDRGGIQFGIKAFNEEFGKEENVCLKIKINTSYNLPNWNLQKQIDELKLQPNKAPIMINTDMVEYDKLVKFYNDGDVFVSCSMGDAFDLPSLEATACGLPVIATANNGHCDFTNEKNGWIIEKGEMVEWSKEIQYEGVKWFKPDIKEIRRLMRYVFEHRDEVIKKGKQALIDSKNFTWENSAKKLLKIIS